MDTKKAIEELEKMAGCLNQGEKHYANAMALLKGQKAPEQTEETGQEEEMQGVF